ncbi:MAG: DUF1593 domain-containing protein [Actinobacteria bacterium]|nr:DUF1593 domain-containing protein [Actinomycetota bacterium]
MTTRDTAGEQLIVDALLDDDPRPILFGAWGGANTLAQALWTIKTEHSQAEWDRAVAKTRVYAIWYQDNGGRWIEENFRRSRYSRRSDGTWPGTTASCRAPPPTTSRS